MTVYGFGERKTPKPFVAACDKFIYVENLRFADEDAGRGRRRRRASSRRGPSRRRRRSSRTTPRS